ncbi:MAG: RNA polymerase sigma factor RpoH [Syntrophorhabdaceae bacterium PtaU1.Bin034]|nr:MAG: RNA polymerase sigma factor RpoH [Syntrophorhabdaceae bacterium PtaU1.Bin034]
MLQEIFVYERKEPVVKEPEENVPVPFDPLKKYLSEISRHSVLSREEELEIAERAHRYKDTAASQKLVTSNLRLVVKIALEYYNTYLNILDLIQEGNVGLVHAVKKYNPYKGTRFSTYSSFWIRAYILKYIMDSWSIVKVGTTQSQRRLFYRLKKEKKKLEAIGVFPAPQLLASTLDVKVGEVEDMEKRLSYTDISLEHPVYEEGEETFMDMIRTDDNIEEVVAAKEKKEILERKILEFKKMLNDKELFIFEHRIMIEEPLTLQEIGEQFKISRERVRQLENRVLKKFNDKFELEFKKLDL